MNASHTGTARTALPPADAMTDVRTRPLARADVTAHTVLVDELAALIETHGTLYEWAAEQPQAQAMKGRAPVYVASLPSGMETVVVRHAWHGGLLAPLTHDRFWRPSRAPLEMERSSRLIAARIPTAVVLGYARYNAGFGTCRVDVVTRFVADSCDLGMVIAGLMPGIDCAQALEATHTLLVRLAQAGVVHPDLNVKNVLLTRTAGGALTALIIDVDTIQWDPARAPSDTMRANLGRLARSIRKWRGEFGCEVTDTVLGQFTARALAAANASGA